MCMVYKQGCRSALCPPPCNDMRAPCGADSDTYSGRAQRDAAPFDLLYYDGLAMQDALIREWRAPLKP